MFRFFELNVNKYRIIVINCKEFFWVNFFYIFVMLYVFFYGFKLNENGNFFIC